MSAVCIIPARGGSTRIPGKNRRMFHGKPIIAYSIEAALASKLFDVVVVSTDDENIAIVAASYGAHPIPRPTKMAANEVGTQEVMRDALRFLNEGKDSLGTTNGQWDFACCIYATAPLMDVRALDIGFDSVNSRGHAYAYSVHKWRDAGQFYFGATDAFLDGIPLSHWSTMHLDIGADRFCDINTESDWIRAEAMYAALHGVKH